MVRMMVLVFMLLAPQQAFADGIFDRFRSPTWDKWDNAFWGAAAAYTALAAYDAVKSTEYFKSGVCIEANPVFKKLVGERGPRRAMTVKFTINVGMVGAGVAIKNKVDKKVAVGQMVAMAVVQGYVDYRNDKTCGGA